MATPLQHVSSRMIASRMCRLHRRTFSCSHTKAKGIVLGVYKPKEKDGEFVLTPASKHFDSISNGKLTQLINMCPRKFKKLRVLYDVVPEYSSIAVCCIGNQTDAYNEAELLDLGRENVRVAVARGVTTLRDIELDVEVDPCGNAEAAAEGAYLSCFSYDENKSKDNKAQAVNLSCFQTGLSASGSRDIEWWKCGETKAAGQNLARYLMETPGNLMTPQNFVDLAKNKFEGTTVDLKIGNKSFIEKEEMNALLAVAQGSKEPPYFLHASYKHPQSTQSKPIALVGKGVTFDTGGISLKPPASMDMMRGDMGGAACVMGAVYTVMKLGLPVHIEAFIPLTENMPGGQAIKPGDVVTARNKKTIQIDNTDAEGRLILADALSYAETVDPMLIVDLATLTGAIDVALGLAVSGAYSTSTKLYRVLEEAGAHTGDRVWRMPLLKHYTKQVTPADLADLNNIGKSGRAGGSCTAAAFLKEFVTNKNWIHLDIAGVMHNKGEDSCLGKGMTGRPTRTLVEFIERVVKQQNI